MYVILGNGGVIWDVGQYIGYLAIYAYWVKYALLGNVYFISNVWYTGRYMIYIFGNFWDVDPCIVYLALYKNWPIFGLLAEVWYIG